MLADQSKINNLLKCLRIVPNESLPVKAIDKKLYLLSNFELFRIEEVTYEKTAPRKEALENVVSALRMDGINFVYLLIGDRQKGVSFYFGVASDLYDSQKTDVALCDIADRILKTSILGNFRGSSVKSLEPEEKKQILSLLNNDKVYKNIHLMQGIPGINKDDEEFQAVNRLVDVMQNENFAFMLIARPLKDAEILDIENDVYDLYSEMATFSKMSQQGSFSDGKTMGVTTSNGTSSSSSKGTSSAISSTEGSSEGFSDTKSHSEGTGTSSNQGKNSTNKSGGTSHTDQRGTSSSTTSSESKTINKTSGKTESVSENVGSSTNTSTSFTIERLDKRLVDLQKYLDEVLLPRLDYSKGKGLFLTSALLFTETPDQMQELKSTICALYSGESGNKNPLRIQNVKELNDKSLIDAMRHFQLPHANRPLIGKDKQSVYAVYSRSPFYSIGNCYSARELSLIAGLPQKEVRGLPLRAEVEFGLNTPLKSESSILMGKLVQSGNVLDTEVYLDKDILDKHVFVTGVTGSGKTTTCQRLLIESKLPFCVIEPAKTEYRILKQKYEDLLVFTLGDDRIAPFRLNPFELLPSESLSSHVDMLKACFEASFDMEAAIPQIVEATIYKIYKAKGWNEEDDTNSHYDDPYAEGVCSFPMIDDFIAAVPEVVREQGFDERLKDEYIGSIVARFQALTHGAKGKMLNTPRSIDFYKLLDRKVVLELEPIRNPGEKALIMGLILSVLGEVIKQKYRDSSGFKHITLVEEAHRLLAKWTPSDGMNRKQSVEIFADMLAEVRKYGECFIIADQIPNKLTPDVLKNTNTKIVHRLFAQDDKEAIGNTMALEDEQKNFLSSLETGRAIMFSQNAGNATSTGKSGSWNKPVQIKVERQEDNDTGRKPYSDAILRKACLEFYAESSIGKKVSANTLEFFAKEILSLDFARKFVNYVGGPRCHKEGRDEEKELLALIELLVNNGFALEYLSSYLDQLLYSSKENSKYSEERKQSFVEVFNNGRLKDLRKDLFMGFNN